MLLRTLSAAACTVVLLASSSATMHAQTGAMSGQPAAAATPLASPAASAHVTLAGGTVTIDYHAPSMRGRPIMGALVPYDKVWRTGANDATTLITPVSLHIGNLLVPAGTYTLFTLPSADKWLLIVSKDKGEWGLAYKEPMDLGRVPMKVKSISTPQEIMSISFEDTKDKQTEMHVRWEKTDVSVKITTP